MSSKSRALAALAALSLIAVGSVMVPELPASAADPAAPAVDWSETLPTDVSADSPLVTSPDGSSAYLVTSSGAIETIDTESGLPLGYATIALEPNTPLTSVRATSTGLLWALRDVGGHAELDGILAATGAVPERVRLEDVCMSGRGSRNMILSADGTVAYVFCSGGVAEVVDTTTVHVTANWRFSPLETLYFSAGQLAPDGEIWGTWNSYSRYATVVGLFDPDSGMLEPSAESPGNLIGISADQTRAVEAVLDPTRDVYALKSVDLADGSVNDITDLPSKTMSAIASDGTEVFSGTVDPTEPSALIDLTTGTRVDVAGEPLAVPGQVRAAADGGFVVTALGTTNVMFHMADRGATPRLVATAQPQIVNLHVGKTATITTGTWSARPDALTYQWYEDFKPIAGATAASLPITGQMFDHHIYAAVTATGAGYANGTVVSRDWWDEPALGQQTAPVPTISGTPKSGSTLTANPGAWLKGTTFTYQWLRGGKSIPGATHKTLAVTADYRGSSLSVEVTGALTGYGTVAQTSAEVIVPGRPPFRPTVKPALDGADRYATAVASSKDSYPVAGSAKTVVVTAGENFPDALSAAPAAVKLGGPLLLTMQSRLPSAVSAEIKRLRPKRIVVVGGTAAVSASVQSELSHLAPTSRVAGANRYATSLAIDKYAFGSTNVSKIYFATGTSFPDALSASAYAGGAGVPVLLVPGNTPPLLDRPDGNLSLLPTGVVPWVRGAHVKQFDIVGGPAAISYSMNTAILSLAGSLGAFVYRGADRFETNRLVIDDNPSYIYTGVKTAYVASGMNFPDALAGAAAAGKAKVPLVLVKPGCVPAASSNLLQDMGVTTVKVLGGPAAIGSGVARMALCR